MGTYSTIVFDFDGTMVDSLDVVVKDVNRVVKEFGYRPIKEESIERAISGGANSFFNRFQIFRDVTNKLISAVQIEQGRHIKELELVPGLLTVLETLKKRGYSLGIVSSNTLANVKAYLLDRKMEALFDFVYAGGEVNDKAKVMEKMLVKRALKPEAIVYVGDEPRDILAARETGVEAVGVTWGFQPKKAFTEVKPTWLIDKPDELLDIFPKQSWWRFGLLKKMQTLD